MNTTLGIPLESFNLDEREFERCKVWSSLIKRYSTIEDDRLIDLGNLETEFCENFEEDEIDDPGEVSLDEDENENNPLNQSVMQLHTLRTTLINAQPRAASNGKNANVELSEPLAKANEDDGDFDLQDILDQTLPILAERDRKWKESGMLNILNTFDEEKIERKVGSWLRINSSIQAATTTHSAQVQLPDDDDSLHSMDTARYVLSNRKPRSSNCWSTIKSYRLLQSKRDALHEKYAFSEDELERALRQHVNGLRSRNNLKARNDCLAEHKLQRSSDNGLGIAKKRRKLFNKQRVRTCNSNRCFGSSSSSDENLEDDSVEQYNRQLRRLPAACTTSLRTPMVKSTLSLARLRSVSATAPCSSRFKRNQLQALKPRKRASECCCFKEEKLCMLTEHLADTSTEEWLVENCDSPKKVPKNQQNKTSEPEEVQLTKTTTTKKKNRKAATQNKTVAEKTFTDKKPKTCTDVSLLESTFERELQKAIELSKQTFEMETMVIKGQCAELKNKKIKNTKLKTKAKQPKSEVGLTEYNSDDHHIKSKTMHNVEIVENKAANNHDKSKELSKVSALENIPTQSKQHRKSLKEQEPMQAQTQPIQAEKAQEKKKVSQEEPLNAKKNKSLKQQSRVDFSQLPQLVDMSPSIIDDISPARLGLKPQPKSAKLKKMKRLTVKNHSVTAIKNDTFFSQADKICNSTAVVNDVIAMNKQFSTESVNSSTTTSETTLTAPKTTDDLDCTIVSSTTDDSKQRKISNATYTTNNHANRDILLYTPHNRTLAPAHSYSEGVFSITEEHLSAVIGEKVARKFMKYYIGRRRFDANLTVYYRPPRRLWHNNSRADDDETDSDVDALEQIDHFGDLYALFDK